MMPVCSNIRKQSVYVQEPRYPDLVNLQTRFESVMESTGYGINLALDMKNSEMAVRDLNTLVGGISYHRDTLFLQNTFRLSSQIWCPKTCSLRHWMTLYRPRRMQVATSAN